MKDSVGIAPVMNMALLDNIYRAKDIPKWENLEIKNERLDGHDWQLYSNGNRIMYFSQEYLAQAMAYCIEHNVVPNWLGIT